jgi:hypothetical protein
MKIRKRLFIDSRFDPLLARLFSANVIQDLAATGSSKKAFKILSELHLIDSLDPRMILRDFYDDLFELIFRKYRNEYVYKNAIADKILLGRHSLNSSFMLSEFRAGNCKADSVILNGSSTVYEIKSAYDSVARLERQLNAYHKVFDRINVITSDDQLSKVERVIGDSVGLMVLSDRYTIRTIKEAVSQKSYVDSSVIFDSLRKPEYLAIIKARFGFVPNVPNTRIYAECKRLFIGLDPEAAHDEMVKILKKRGECYLLRDFITRVPDSLKAVSLSCKLTNKDRLGFLNLLDKEVGETLLAY